jgi:phage protein U
MYAQLGTFVFEGLKGFTNYNETFSSSYAEQALILSKPRLQATGQKLRNISFSLTLHASFTNPKADFDTLNNYRINSEILPFIQGNGEFIGDFIITDVSKYINQTDKDGSLLSITLGVDLKEVFVQNLNAVERKKAVEAAFATSQANASKDTNVSKQEGTQVLQNLNTANVETSKVDTLVKQAETNPNKLEQIGKSIEKTLNKVNAAYESVNHILETADNIYQKVVNLPYAINGAIANINAMKAALPITSIEELRYNNSILQGSTKNVGSASVNLVSSNSARRI